MSESNKSSKICWVVTAGDVGTVNQCVGVAEALGLTPIIKTIKLRSPWLQLVPWLRIGTKYSIHPDGDQLSAPWPDIVVACGRKSIGLAIYIKKMSGGKTFIVQIQNPNIPAKHFDLVAVPMHDQMKKAENVMVTVGATHRVTAAKIAGEMSKFNDTIAPLPNPRFCLIVGGNSGAYTLTAERSRELGQQMKALQDQHGGSLLVTVSRRTGEENTALLRDALKDAKNVYFYDTLSGENPYFAFLGYADYIIVTEDSVSMISEAISTGKPVFSAKLDGGTPRFNLFHQAMEKGGYVRPFRGALEKWSYKTPTDTQDVAREIEKRMKERA